MRWCSRVSGCVQPGHARVSGRSDRCSCRCSVWLRPAVRASGRLSRPKGAVRCHEPGGGGSTRTQRKTPEHVENCSITCAHPSPTALVTAPPRAYAACRCIWSLTAIMRAPLPRRSWDLLEFLLILSVFSTSFVSSSACSSSREDSETTRGVHIRGARPCRYRATCTYRHRSPPMLTSP